MTPRLWSLASLPRLRPSIPQPLAPPSCGCPQWGLLTAQRVHSATMQQLGQFGEENKHFLPVLGLAARQTAGQLQFPGATGLGGAGGRSLRGAEGARFPPPWEGGRRGRGTLGRPAQNLWPMGTPAASRTLPGPCFPVRPSSLILDSPFGFPLLREWGSCWAGDTHFLGPCPAVLGVLGSATGRLPCRSEGQPATPGPRGCKGTWALSSQGTW